MSKHIVNPDGLMSLKKSGVEVENDQTDIQLVSESDLAKAASDEAFMQESMTIRIAPSINPNDAPYATITFSAPGRTERALIPRGEPIVVKRAHVEILARLKQVSYFQRPSPSVDLELGNRLFSNVGLVYPFEVMEDKNPKGRAWLDNILAEPV